MRKTVFRTAIAAAVAAPVAMSAPMVCADAVEDFYKGKQMRLVIHVPPGGGYDAYGRLMARHITRHIPGGPSIIVQNMPGGGGIRAVNFVGTVAPKDGSVLTLVSQGLPMFQAMGKGSSSKTKLDTDLATFNWIGNLSDSNQTLVTWHTSKTKALKDLQTRETIMGGTGVGSISVQLPALLNALVGAKIKIVYGYAGGAALNLAMERGELEGRAANTWASYNATQPAWIKDKKLNFILQIGLKEEPALKGVPMLLAMGTNDVDRKVLKVICQTAAFGRPVATSPGVPVDRVAALRRAFDATVKDSKLLAEAAKQHMEVSTMNGAEVQELVSEITSVPKPVIARLAEAMKPVGAERAKNLPPPKKKKKKSSN
jgi:tripartite-type tricarboxylate transporter receptor subunit TctC